MYMCSYYSQTIKYSWSRYSLRRRENIVPFSWSFNACLSSVSQNADLKWRGNTNRDQPSRGISSYDDFILFLKCFSPMEYVELLYGIFWENTIWVMSFYWFFKSVKGVKYWFYFFKLNSNNSCFRSSFPTGLQIFKKLDYLHSSWNLWILFK